MYSALALTYLFAAGIEPRPRSLMLPPGRRRRHRTRATLVWLLLVAGDGLQRAGHRLSSLSA
jgi:hypothetical protein